MRKKILFILIITLLAVTGYLVFYKSTNSSSSKSSKDGGSKNSAVGSNVFNKQLYSLTDPTSVWVIVNKQHPLNPKDYVPSDLVMPSVPLRVPGNESMQLRGATAAALEQMFADARTQGIGLMLSSGYRSYTYQVNLYNGYVQSQGQVAADQESARPGYSEHQTGFAADIEPASRNCEIQACFGDTPEGKWLAANGYKYGFIIRYTAADQSISGYEPEPWHVRYVGTALATEMHNTNVETLEQFFNVSGGSTYN